MASFFGGAKSLRAAAGVIAAAASSAADLRHVDGLKESIHSAAGDALRLVKDNPSPEDEERVIHGVASLFFEIVSLELKSQDNLRQRLSRAESELDFASAQLRRRDAFIASMREDMLRDIQSANELVRQHVTKYNDLVAEGARSSTSAAAASLSKKVSKYGSAGMEASSQQESTSDPTSPVMAMPRLIDTKELEKRLDQEQATAMVEPDKKTQEQVLRETMERKLKDIQIRLQREHDVLLHRTAKRGDEMLKTECAKLESKVRQLEQQLRRKEADAELQLQKERDRWRLQMQRATETAKATLANKLWCVLKDLESSRMEVHDVAGHAEANNVALRQRIRELERQLLDAHSRGDGSPLSPKESLSEGALENHNNSIEASARTTFAGLTPSAPSGGPKNSKLGRSSVAFDDASGKAAGCGDANSRSPRRRRGSRGSTSAAAAANKFNNRNSVLSASTSSTSRFGAIDETAALKDTLETLRRNLTIAVLARDEAIAERDALAEELTTGPDGPASAALMRVKNANGTGSDGASGGSCASPVLRGVDAMVRAVDTDLRRLLTEFTNGRNDVFLSLQTKMARHLRRTSSYTASPRMPEEDVPTVGVGAASSARQLRVLSASNADQQRQALSDTRSPFRLDSARLPSPTEDDFSDVLRIVGMSPQQRPPSAGRLRTNSTPTHCPPLPAPPAGPASFRSGVQRVGSPREGAPAGLNDETSGPSSPLEGLI